MFIIFANYSFLIFNYKYEAFSNFRYKNIYAAYQKQPILIVSYMLLPCTC